MKKLKNLMNSLKDKASIAKATFFSLHSYSSSIRLAVIRATTHNAANPPSETRIAAVLAIGHDFPSTACACIETLLDRLHTTSNAAVAMKSLFTLHFLLIKGSFNLRDQASFYPYHGGRNFLNLSTFRDVSDSGEMSDFSSWVRWYAGVVEQNIMVSRKIGHCLYFRSRNGEKERKISGFSTAELDVLVDFAERVSEFPESLHLQKNDLVYEVVRLVMENYRLVQREILIRVKKIGERLESLSLDELTQLNRTITRYEDCRRRLSSLFVNRVNNEDLWDLIKETKKKLKEEKKEKEMKMMVIRTEPVEPARFWNPFLEPGQLLWIPSCDEPMGPSLLPLTVSTVG